MSLGSFELLYDPDIPVSEPLTIEDAVCSVVRLYESKVDVAAKYWQARRESLRQAVANREEPDEITQRRDTILNNETTIVKSATYIPGETYSGTAYYISNNGNDNNDGLSPKTAWATLDRVARQSMQPGDAIFLERSGTYRGYLAPAVPNLTISAYGKGPKPVVTSAEDGAGEEKWELYYEDGSGKKIWKFYKDVTDAGTVVFDDSVAARKITAIWSGTEWINEDYSAIDVTTALEKDLDFFSDVAPAVGDLFDVQYGPIYLRCDRGNPGSLYHQTELCVMSVPPDQGKYDGSVMGTEDGTTLDNLSIKYFGWAGVAYSPLSHRNVIQNCEFAWGGGCIQYLDLEGRVSGRAGDALCGIGPSNLTVCNNYFHDLATGVVDWEAYGLIAEYENFLFSGNLAERTQGLTFAQEIGGSLKGFVVDDNIFSQAGLSWFDTQNANTALWAGGDWGKDIKIRMNDGVHFEGRITNNSFYDFLQFSLFFRSDVPGEMPVMSGNRYYINEYTGNLAWWTTSDIPQLYHTIGADEAENFLRNYLHDTTSVVIRSTGTPGVPAGGTAYPSTQTVELDGKKVEFQMYALLDENGYQTNYIKIRDLALALNGTKAQFNVGWNGAINLETGKAYVPNGSENKIPFSGERAYTVSTSPTNLNGTAVDLAGIVLKDDAGGGYTYCQVKDLGVKLNFNVAWSAARGICIETDKPYSGN